MRGVRINAIRVLGEMGDHRASSFIREILEEVRKDPEVRLPLKLGRWKGNWPGRFLYGLLNEDGADFEPFLVLDLFECVHPGHFEYLFEVAKKLQTMIYSCRALSKLKDTSSFGLLEEIAKETPFDFVRERIRSAMPPGFRPQ